MMFDFDKLKNNQVYYDGGCFQVLVCEAYINDDDDYPTSSFQIRPIYARIVEDKNDKRCLWLKVDADEFRRKLQEEISDGENLKFYYLEGDNSEDYWRCYMKPTSYNEELNLLYFEDISNIDE